MSTMNILFWLIYLEYRAGATHRLIFDKNQLSLSVLSLHIIQPMKVYRQVIQTFYTLEYGEC